MHPDQIFTLQNIGSFLIICAPIAIFILILYGIAVVAERIADALKKITEALLKLTITFAIILMLAYGVYLATGGKTKQAKVRLEGKGITVEVEKEVEK